MATTADIIVIGGGIAGIGVAANLAPDARVIVLEAEDAIGYHATGRSAAIFIRNYGNATLRALNAASAPFFDDPGDFCDAPLLSQRGEIIVASEPEVADLESYMRGTEGVVEISAQEAVERFPLLRADRIARVAIEESASDIDVDRLLQGFARVLRRHGGKIETGAPVREVERVGGNWQVTTAKGTFNAPVVVNAAGAWADRIAARASVAQVGLQPMRRSGVLIPMEHDVSRWPVVAGASETWYAKPDAGKLMISPADEDPVDPHDAWPEDIILAEGIDRFEQMMTMTVTRVERSWAGLRTFAPDRTPVVGYTANAEGFFWLAGQGGYGIQTSPALSRLAADLILRRDTILSDTVVAALAPDRGSLAGEMKATTTMPRCT